MAIELEKILSVTAQDYIGASGNIRGEYELKGIHLSEYTSNPEILKTAVQAFAALVPDKAEAVVGYQNNTRINELLHYIQITGTALIPK